MSLAMKLVNNVATDLGAKGVAGAPSGTPFQAGFNVVILNLGATTPVVSTSDDGVTYAPATTPSPMAANSATPITLKRFIKTDLATSTVLLGAI